MERERVALVLEEIGLLLELLGENPFKTRAYANAARVVRALDRDVVELVERRELVRVRGIGAAIAGKIAVLVREGRLDYLEGLRAQIPPGLLDWLRVPGLGAKKARAIHVALGLTRLDELEQACRQGKLSELPGFGEVSQRKILAGIERLRRHAGRWLRPLVAAEAARLLESIRSVAGVRRAESAGSVRRCLETAKDIDLVVAADDPDSVMDAFTGAAGVASITGRGPTKCSVLLEAGPAADLRVVSEAAFPFALAYFTGSKAHNVALRSRALRRGLKLNEYALVREADGTSLDCADEAAIYAALGLVWIPPELREDQGEIEAAAEDALPRLISTGDLQGVLHVHSSWSDGSATIEEMADAARRRGFAYLGLCDHSKAAVYANGLDAERLARQGEEVERLNRASGMHGLRILHGVEVDILPDGSLDLPDAVLARLDFVVASIHSAFQLDEAEQTRRLLRALDHPRVDVLGHPTGRRLLSRDGYAIDVGAVLERAAERGVAVELNANPQRLDLDWRHLRYGLRLGLRTSINPDAHSAAELDYLAYGVDAARKGWCTAGDALNAWPLEQLTAHLQARRERAGAGEPAP